MSNYVLQVNYGPDDEPVRIPLTGYAAGDAETAHQALETEIEHARSMNAPVIFSGPEGSDSVPIDPARVSGVNLIDAASSD